VGKEARELGDECMRALALATRHVNASIAYPFEEADLLNWIHSEIPADRLEHVRSFIDETDTATLQDLVISGAVSYRELAELADKLLPATHDTRKWLNDRRTF
jgi:hypothetical protein